MQNIIKKTFVLVFLISCLLLSVVQPSLACRMIAVLQAPNSQKDSLITEILLKGENSLRKQSKPKRKTVFKIYKATKLEHSSSLHSRLYKRRLLKGNIDGWGIKAYTNSQSITKYTGIKPAYKDRQFKKSVKKLTKKQPIVVLAHIRAASDKTTLKLDNTHPFIYKHWSFMHNGTLVGMTKPDVQSKILNKYALHNHKVVVDSEMIFHYILSKIEEETGMDSQYLRIKDIGINKFRNIFVRSALELLEVTDRKYKVLPDGYKATYSPIANFVMTDGETIIAFKKGTSLYLGSYGHNNKSYILASEVIQPRGYHKKPEKFIKWQNIPEEQIITIYRNQQSGKINYETAHIAEYLF